MRWNSIVVSGSRCELNHLLVAFDIFTDIGPCESIHFYSFLILIVTYRAWCNKTLFFFSVPQNELFSLSTAIAGESPLNLGDIRVILGLVKAISFVIIDLNISLQITSSLITFIAMPKQTGLLWINWSNINISFHVVVVWWRHWLVDFSQK